MRIVFLPSDLDGSAHYRILNPARELARTPGFECQVAPHVIQRGPKGPVVMYGDWNVTDGKLSLARSVFDWLEQTQFDVLVMGQRSEPEWARQIKRLRALGKRVLVDSDDCWLGLPYWNPGSGRPTVETQAMLAQLKAADGLSVATPALAKVYERWQPNTRVIRNRLDWRMWADVTPVYESRRWERLRVGWMGAARWRGGDIQLLKSVLGPWLQRHPEVDFVAAGDPTVHDIIGVPAAQRVTTNSVNFWDGDLADITAVMDIGLVPLDTTDKKSRRLNDCKSHLKGMEYNACGIPFVASPTESYQWWASDSRVGFVANTAAQWENVLDALTVTAVREYMGRAARAKAGEWTIQNGGVNEWAEWLGGRAHGDAARTPHGARELSGVR